MSDDNDKTVFMPPQGSQNPPEDRTVIMPAPGSRAPGARAAPTASTPGPTPQATVPPARVAASEVVVRRGLNPVVASASMVMTVSSRLRTIMTHDNVAQLQRQLIDELKNFENLARQANVANNHILSSRYLLCTMLDEIVLNTPWGATSRWGEHSLLSQFHNETSGGEKCFALLKRMLEDPSAHIDVLELFYQCLSLGFEGKFKLDPRGKEQLERISNALYQTISQFRGEFEPELSINWQSRARVKRSMMEYIPLWVVASCVALTLVLVFSGFRLWLYQSTEAEVERIDKLATVLESGRSQ